MTLEAGVRLSPLDTARWGVVTATAGAVTAESLPGVLEFANLHAVTLLVARCSAADLVAARAMEAAGFRLMDALVVYARDVGAANAGDLAAGTVAGDAAVRLAREDEAAEVRAVARAAFRGYGGHYHADPRLDREACDEVYADWAHRSCASPGVADGVLVAEVDGRVAAFATLRFNSATEGEGVLFGVAPGARGRGLYPLLMGAGLRFCAERGRTRMVVSTQITNLTVQRAWIRLAFEPCRAEYTFHRWCTDPGAPPAA